MSCECEKENQDGEQKTILVTLLAINGSMFFLELAVGVFAESTALIADAFDMLTDATVHGISLYAVGRARKWLSRRFELAPCMMP